MNAVHISSLGIGNYFFPLLVVVNIYPQFSLEGVNICVNLEVSCLIFIYKIITVLSFPQKVVGTY